MGLDGGGDAKCVKGGYGDGGFKQYYRAVEGASSAETEPAPFCLERTWIH